MFQFPFHKLESGKKLTVTDSEKHPAFIGDYIWCSRKKFAVRAYGGEHRIASEWDGTRAD